MTLEQLIHARVANRMRGLTLWPTENGKWQANLTVGGNGWRVCTNADPVEALREVLSSPMAPVDTIREPAPEPAQPDLADMLS